MQVQPAAVWLGPALLWLAACSVTPQRYEFSAPKMGTTVGITLYALDQASAKAAADVAFARIDELNSVLSDYESDSEINRLSRSAGSGREVVVSDDLMAVLLRAQEISRLTDGAFDITAGAPIRLWRRARRTQQMPDPALLREAMQSVGWQHVHLDPRRRTVKLDKPGVHLDVGGIAKGYTAAEVLKVLQATGHGRALVAMAGDVSAAQPPPGQRGWRISIDQLLQESSSKQAGSSGGSSAGTSGGGASGGGASGGGGGGPHVLLSGAHVSTSGDAYQYVIIDGVRYSHILDPRTGAAITTPIAATVISTDAAAADALATAISIMGVEKGRSLIDQLPATAALISYVDDRGKLQHVESARLRKLLFAPFVDR